ncbi:MAG: HAD family hydrolase [Polyangiaceae bacterium]
MSDPAVRALLVDLDDTLYDYAPVDGAARNSLFAAISSDLGIERAVVEKAWDESRARVKARLGKRASSHSRLLYLMDLAHRLDAPRALKKVRAWDELFWKTYVSEAKLRTGVLPLLRAFRARGGKVAIVTDLTLAPQLDKLDAFALFDEVDAVVASEEVPEDKPAREIFDLALERLGVRGEECLVVGDSAEKDGAGARAIGARFFHVISSEPGAAGRTLEDLAKELFDGTT